MPSAQAVAISLTSPRARFMPGVRAKFKVGKNWLFFKKKSVNVLWAKLDEYGDDKNIK